MMQLKIDTGQPHHANGGHEDDTQLEATSRFLSRLRQRLFLALPILTICFFAGCSTVSSVKRMDESLDAIRPPIQELPAVRESLTEVADRTAALEQTAVQMAATLSGVHDEIGEMSDEMGELSNVVRGLERLEQKIDLVNQELEQLSQLPAGIEGVQRNLGKLDELDEGIASINGQLGGLNDQLSELGSVLVVMNDRLERLSSIDNQLLVVDESIKKLHRLVPIAVLAVPLLALWMMISIFSQWLTRRRAFSSRVQVPE